MKKQQLKIRMLISFAWIAIVMIGGILVFLTAPDQKTSDDQLQLQQELQENAKLLEEQENAKLLEEQKNAKLLEEQKTQGGQENQDTMPPTISDDSAAQETSKENLTQQFTAIGDSVMLGAVPALKEIFPNSIISAAESRQVWEAETIATELKSKGELMDTIVIALGANGSFSKKQGQSLLESFGQDCQIYWIAPYGKNLYWKESTLEILQDLEAENENLTVLDWPDEAEQHTDWFYDDGMHLNDAGKIGYAQFLRDNLSGESN